jgi:hypothetical protein
MRSIRCYFALAAAALLCGGCHWPLLVGGITSSCEEAYWLGATAEPVPASPADGAWQAQADSVLDYRWSSFGLHYHVGTAKVSHLQLAAGDYPTSAAPPQSVNFPYEAYGPPGQQAELTVGHLALSGAMATWTVQPPDAGTLTGVTLSGTFSRDEADGIVKALHKLNPPQAPNHSDPYLHSSEVFTVNWTVSGQSGGAPFTARFTQAFSAARLSYGENI